MLVHKLKIYLLSGFNNAEMILELWHKDTFRLFTDNRLPGEKGRMFENFLEQFIYISKLILLKVTNFK